MSSGFISHTDNISSQYNHYGQLVWGAVGAGDGSTGTHLLWLLGTAIMFGLLAVWGYRRDQGKQYG